MNQSSKSKKDSRRSLTPADNGLTDKSSISSKSEWKTIPNFPDYEISTDGSVRSKVGGELVKQFVYTKDGYYAVYLLLDKKQVRRAVHRLVLQTYRPTSDSTMFGLHNDGNPANNRLDNLRWGTAKDNWDDAVKHGTAVNQGEKNYFAKLKPHQVIEIRERYAKGNITQRELAAEYNIGAQNLWLLINRRIWKKI